MRGSAGNPKLSSMSCYSSFEQGKIAMQQGGGLEDTKDLQGIQREKVKDEENIMADIKGVEVRNETTKN